MPAGPSRSPLPGPELRALAALLERPIVAVDVGCREGARPAWRELGEHGLLVGFDPDPDECARLNAAAGDAGRERYEPLALAATAAELALHVTTDPQSSSLYAPNPAAIRRYPELWRHHERATETIQTTTLDAMRGQRPAS